MSLIALERARFLFLGESMRKDRIIQPQAAQMVEEVPRVTYSGLPSFGDPQIEVTRVAWGGHSRVLPYSPFNRFGGSHQVSRAHKS